MKAAVLGAGGAGRGMTAYLASLGHRVRVWNRDLPAERESWIDPLAELGLLEATGALGGRFPIDSATTEMSHAVEDADVVFVTTTADAHGEVADALAPVIAPHQVIVVMACKTGGAWEVRSRLGGVAAPIVAEAPTTVVNSRVSGAGSVEILGVKRSIPLATLPRGEVNRVSGMMPDLPFAQAPSVLSTSLDNLSIALHVVPMLANAGRIGSGSGFRFYRDGISAEVARLMSAVDDERIDIGRRFEARVVDLESYLIDSMGAPGGGLYRSIQGCLPYATVPAPPAVDHKYLWEEVLAGVVPMIGLGEVVGANTPLLRALLALSSSLLGRDLTGQGRSLSRMGLAGLDREGILAAL